MDSYSEKYSIIYIEDSNEDGIPIMSPFTGVPLRKILQEEIKHEDDPSLLFFFCGGPSLFSYVRQDISEYLDDEFYYEVAKKFHNKDDKKEMGQGFIDTFKAISVYLKKKFKIHSSVIIQNGGYNGMLATGYEHGYIDDDDQWFTLGS